MSKLQDVLNLIDNNQPQALERLCSLLTIKSISTDSEYAEDCVKAANWLVEDLNSIGFDAQRHDTPGHPMVVAKLFTDENKPHYLFYGHYDVQPVDPIELWNSPPFEPQIEDSSQGKVIRARGAADDKGQLMTFVEACRAWKQVTGTLPANITLFFEGEEESGSPSPACGTKIHPLFRQCYAVWLVNNLLLQVHRWIYTLACMVALPLTRFA